MKLNRNIFRFLAVLAMSVGLGGCTWSDTDPDTVEDKSPKQLYADAQASMAEGDYKRAAEILLAHSSRYPYGLYSDQVNLDLIYCYYKNEDNTKGLQTADRFINANPTHKDLDYVYYMRGLILMQMDSDLLHSIFAVDRYDRDPEYTEEAFRDFGFIVNQMADSKYAPDAKVRMLFLKNRLAKYYLAIAQYYYDRRAYVAAANRSKKLIDSFYDTTSAEEALEIMIKSYRKLGLIEMETEARKLMALNFPKNSMAAK
ncbi:MAG: outer membrane protein assembly factor BamD [Succinivibrionaceae bacterium]|nr:outer membrane protein assembly factor BamD [Succinivibrionaceae bacterium]